MSQHMQTAQIIIIVALAFTALSIGCAVLIGRRRPTPADPFSVPFGEMPGFSAEQLRRLRPKVDPEDPLRRSFAVRDRLKRQAQPLLLIRSTNSVGSALRPADAGGSRGFSSYPPGPAAVVRNFFRWRRHG